MQFAFDIDQNRVHIDDADTSKQYYCPFCGNFMTQRRGQINIHHFAHAKGYLCSDTWHYEEMTEWHIGWQNEYPSKCREVVMKQGDNKHRADVHINNTVIEFQHSSISSEDFKKRNDFYISLGKKVIWLFDVRDDYGKKLNPVNVDATEFEWKYAPKTLTGFDLYGDVQIYFHLSDSDDETIIRLVYAYPDDLSSFKTDKKTVYSRAEFVNITKTGTIFEKDDVDCLFYELQAVRRPDKELCYYDCPVNEDGYAHKEQCDTCRYCKGFKSGRRVVKCAGHYGENAFRIQQLLNWSKIDSDKAVIVYIDLDGRICKDTIMIPRNPGKSIFDLTMEYDPKVMIVRNLNRDRKYMIKGNPINMAIQYKNNVYGQCWLENEGCFVKKGEVIYFPRRPEWIMEWFV